MLIPVILSGGSGTRLWPLSRELYPKQLLPLVGKRTMLQDTVAARRRGSTASARRSSSATRAIASWWPSSCGESGVEPQAIVLEPVGRNTAPAVAVAALLAVASARRRTAPIRDPLLLVLPADHVIRDVTAFQRRRAAGRAAAERRQARDLRRRARPRPRPATATSGAAAGAGPALCRSQQFVEKPDAATRRRYVASRRLLLEQRHVPVPGDAPILAELGAHAPDDARRLRARRSRPRSTTSISRACRQTQFAALPERFDRLRGDGEDRSSRVVVPLDAGWSDVGSWSALQDALPTRRRRQRDHGRRAGRGHARAATCTRRAGWSRAVGLKDHVVVETKDAVLVAPRDRVQDVKQLVAQLKAQGRYETSLHREVFRPWGSYDSIDSGERFQVKRLIVKPGAHDVAAAASSSRRALDRRLGHRAHHARRGDVPARTRTSRPTFRVGTKHRIENPGKIAAAHHRGAVRQLPRRGRHRALRGPVRPRGHDEVGHGTGSESRSFTSVPGMHARGGHTPRHGALMNPHQSSAASRPTTSVAASPTELNEDLAYRSAAPTPRSCKPEEVASAATSASPARSCRKALSRGCSIPASTCTTSACAAPRASTSPPSPKRSTAASWSPPATIRRTTTA